MKLNRFKKLDKKKRMILIGGISIILLIAVVLVYRSYAIYQEKQDFNVIKGTIPDQNYDVFLSYYLVHDDGTRTFSETMPKGRNYKVDIECDKDALGSWNYETWGPTIYNMVQSRTKCKLLFSDPKESFLSIFQSIPKVNSGEGLYEVSHANADITYTEQISAKENLKKTEYRYAGSNPNNYVIFNNQLW